MISNQTHIFSYLVILLISIWYNFFIQQAILQVEEFNNKRRVLEAMNELTGCKFIEYSLDNYLAVNDADIDTNIVHRLFSYQYLFDNPQKYSSWKPHLNKYMLRFISRHWDDTFKTEWHIIMTRREDSKAALPSQLFAFSSDHSAYIFVRDPPNSVSELSKFLIYHEIGHGSGMAKAINGTVKIGSSPFLWLLYWAILNIHWSFSSIAYASSLIAIIATMHSYYWPLTSDQAKMHNEVFADCFALHNISDDEAASLTEFYSEGIIPPYDSSLSSESSYYHRDYNFQRKELFGKNLDERIKGSSVVTHWGWDPRFPMGTFISMIMAFTLGTCGRTPSWWLLIADTLIFGVLPFIFYYGQTEQNQSLSAQIEAKITKAI